MTAQNNMSMTRELWSVCLWRTQLTNVACWRKQLIFVVAQRRTERDILWFDFAAGHWAGHNRGAEVTLTISCWRVLHFVKWQESYARVIKIKKFKKRITFFFLFFNWIILLTNPRELIKERTWPGVRKKSFFGFAKDGVVRISMRLSSVSIRNQTEAMNLACDGHGLFKLKWLYTSVKLHFWKTKVC